MRTDRGCRVRRSLTVFSNNRARLDGFRRGDATVLAEVYRAYVDAVARVFRRGARIASTGVTVPAVRSAARQEELIQEVFVRAFSERARLAYDGLSPYAPYLLRIARNLLVDEARVQGRLQPVEPEKLAELIEASEEACAPALDEALDRAPLLAAAAAFKQSLDPVTLRFVQLRFEDGASQAEVGAALGLTRRQIRTREDEARRSLESFLQERGLGEKAREPRPGFQLVRNSG